MKDKKNDEDAVKKTYYLPQDVCEKIEEIAYLNGRSINSEVVSILRDYFRMPVYWETWIEKAMQKIALEKGCTISWAVNYIVALKLNEFEEESKRIMRKKEELKRNIDRDEERMILKK